MTVSEHEPIHARPPSVIYQVRVFARRNKAVFAAIMAVFLVLVAGVIVSTSLYLRSEAARRDAILARTLAERGFRGRSYWNQRTGEGVHKAIEYFEEAIKKDPNYALAHAALSESYVVMAGHNLAPPRLVLEKARTAAQRALTLDETVSEAHSVMAIVNGIGDWDWEAGFRQCNRAAELNPGNATAYQWLADIILMATGRIEEGLVTAESGRVGPAFIANQDDTSSTALPFAAERREHRVVPPGS
jgi:hypothetical protein